MRVLTVKDEPSQRMLLPRYLRDFKECHTDVAVTGQEAVQPFALVQGEDTPCQVA